MMIGAAVVVAILTIGFLYETIGRQRDRGIPITGRLIDVGGYRLHMTESGSGTPPVVVITGAGDSSYSWIHIRKEVARFARVITYDRPGTGSSDLGPAPDAVRSVEELRTLLTRSGIAGPYLLVGHSLGGIFARLYAKQYPDEVAGMVFVDSTHEFVLKDAKFRKAFAAFPYVFPVIKGMARVGFFRFFGDFLKVIPTVQEGRYYREVLSPEEYRQWAGSVYRLVASNAAVAESKALFPIVEEANRQLEAELDGPQFGALPLAVLTNPAMGESWNEMHRELAGRSTNSVHHMCDRKGHNLQMVRPELVVDAIRWVLGEIQPHADQENDA